MFDTEFNVIRIQYGLVFHMYTFIPFYRMVLYFYVIYNMDYVLCGTIVTKLCGSSCKWSLSEVVLASSVLLTQ